MDFSSIHPDSRPMKRFLSAAILTPEMHPERVGERVAALREALRLSKAQMADQLTLDRSSFTKVEAGGMGLDILVAARLADIYGVGLDYIFRGDLADLPENLRPSVVAELHAVRTANAERRRQRRAATPSAEGLSGQ